ncbi:MAG: hypothetical protein IJG05_02360 [Solobacterium sp.]|nr:hypothetical protein [Solobacterium sp.]
MRNWHSLYEILKFPIGVLLFATFLTGIGNLLTNTAFDSLFVIENTYVLRTAEALQRTGAFLIVNFPVLFLLSMVARRNNSSTTVLSAMAGYVSFALFTMYFSRSDLPSWAYSSLLGISATSTKIREMMNGVYYPLQTGLIGAMGIMPITQWCWHRSRVRNDYGMFSYISKEVSAVISTVFFSALYGALLASVWSFLVLGVQYMIRFIAQDTTNPVKLAAYGILDRGLSVLNLGTYIRAPFWYSASGGTWVTMAGASVAGDVNIWRTQAAASSLGGATGRFITPYYILNIFAIPGMMWANYTLQTDPVEKRRYRLYYILMILMSVLLGTLLPVELILLFLSPLLFGMHLAYTGLLFGALQAMHTYLGFNYGLSGTMAVNPGTLVELLTYLHYPSLTPTIIRMAVVGLVTFAAYFFMTRLYYKRLAIDIFRTDALERIVNNVIDAVGGIDNIKMTNSSPFRLALTLFDPGKMSASKIRKIAAVRIYETKAGYEITFGSASTMIRQGIDAKMRSYVREI